jgi:hypothetical protein
MASEVPIRQQYRHMLPAIRVRYSCHVCRTANVSRRANASGLSCKCTPGWVRRGLWPRERGIRSGDPNREIRPTPNIPWSDDHETHKPLVAKFISVVCLLLCRHHLGNPWVNSVQTLRERRFWTLDMNHWGDKDASEWANLVLWRHKKGKDARSGRPSLRM